MTSPQDFMMAFAKEIIHNVDTRPQIVQEWTEKLEAREAEMQGAMDISKVTRFEVIDHDRGVGRILVKYDVKVELSLQDDDRTLKVFLR